MNKPSFSGNILFLLSLTLMSQILLFPVNSFAASSLNITYDLRLNDTTFSPGLPFVLYREWTNNEPQDIFADEYLALEVFGTYWFWPSWTESLDKQTTTLVAGNRHADYFFEFFWPDAAGQASGLGLIGVLMHADTFDLLGFDQLTWGYTSTPDVFKLTSIAFLSEEAIPAYYTCDGSNVSPAMYWGNPPTGTSSLALIVQDPDAPGGTFTNWIAFDMPVATYTLPEAVTRNEDLPGGGKQGKNGFGQNGYGGPCPPSGTHHYYFTLYALDVNLGLAMGATLAEVTAAMDGHILQQVSLMGVYSHI
jgi:Raf kinase inhibitor-like YbhB/YbcL family protein